MAVKHLIPQPFLDGFSFAEGPRWHRGWLWFSDISGNRVLRARPDGTIETVVELESPSGLGFLPDGSLLITSMHTGRLYRVDSAGKAEVHADLSAYGTTINDMVVTPEGRAYVDVYRPGPPLTHPTGPDGDTCAASGDINRYYLNGLGISPSLEGQIVVVEPDGTHRTAAAGLNYPNGLGITPDGKTLIASISHEGKLLAFTVDPHGNLGAPRLWADLPGRHPDGLCIDQDCAVWVASLAISAFERVLEGGLVTHRVSTPGRWAVAPALGGEDGRTLFAISMEPIDVPGHRSWVECVRVETAGLSVG